MGNPGVKLSDKLRTLFFVFILTFGGFFIAYLSEHEQEIENSGAEGVIEKISYFLSSDVPEMTPQLGSTIEVKKMKHLLEIKPSVYEPPFDTEKISFSNHELLVTSEEIKSSDIVAMTNDEQSNQQVVSLLGWETEASWTGYHLSEGAKGLRIDYEDTTPYGYVSTLFPLTLSEGELTNGVAIKFENVDLSVERISFYLQGDVKLLLEDESPVYYREKIGEYVRGSSSLVQMSFDIIEALDGLAGHMDGGISLVMMIDSDASYSYENLAGSLVVYDLTPIKVSYANNTIRPWQVSGGYEIVQDGYQMTVMYNEVENFEHVSALVVNHQELCHMLNLEFKNIDRSVENVTINVYGVNGEVATMTTELNDYKKNFISVQYDLLEYNPKIGRVYKVELLIDSNPYLEQSNRQGSLEIISISFSQN